jgi:UDP-glucose 4-epimerase
MTTDPGKVVVTGGAGFIGSEMISQLVSSGDDVTVIDNLVSGKRENLDPFLDQGVRLLTTDIRDIEAVSAAIKGADVVYHLACLGVRHSLHSPVENHEVNASATLNLVKASLESGVGRFVHVSSSEVYGTCPEVPMGENSPTHPTTVYGAAKLAGECYVRAYHTSYGYDTVVLRPFNAYGPRSHHEGDSGEVIPKMMLRAKSGKPLIIFGDGEQTRDFTYVADTVKAIISAGNSSDAIGQTINIGSGQETTINDLSEKIISTVGRNDVQIEHHSGRPGEVPRLCADSSKARDILGYQPTVDLFDGLGRLNDWYALSGVSPERLLEKEVVMNWVGEQL